MIDRKGKDFYDDFMRIVNLSHHNFKKGGW